MAEPNLKSPRAPQKIYVTQKTGQSIQSDLTGKISIGEAPSAKTAEPVLLSLKSKPPVANLSRFSNVKLPKEPTAPPKASRVSRISIANSKPQVHLTDKINLAEYMIYFPKEEVLQQARQTQTAQTARETFVSFKTVINKGALNMADSHSVELFSPFNTSRELRNQLDFNKEQESLFRTTADKYFNSSQTNLKHLKKRFDDKLKKMPKVKMMPSLRFPDKQRTAFEDEVAAKEPEDEEKNRIKYPKYLKFMTFGPSDRYYFYWTQMIKDQLAWKPTVRENGSFVILGKFGYLYGGRSKDLNNDVTILDIANWKWIKTPPSKEAPPHGRFGHTANAYKKTMVVFGGVKSYNATLNIRECLSDVWYYVPEIHEWSYTKCSGDFVEPRRNHTAVIVGRHLVVHGGISSTGEYLNDIKALDLISTRWTDCRELNQDPLGVAFHKSCLVVYEQRRDINLFKLPEYNHDGKSPLIKEEGVYYFGGRLGDDTVTNGLRILKFGHLSLKWITPETLGKPPEARYLHTMVHCRPLNMLVIYGGRNDALYARGESPIFGDFYTLQLETLTWVGVNSYGSQALQRFSHVSAVTGTSLIIFGGINFNVYCPAEVSVVEMDQIAVNKLVKATQERRSSFGLPDELANSPLAKYNAAERAFTEDAEEKYTGMVSFLPLPTQAKREKSKPEDIIKKKKKTFFLSARVSTEGLRQADLDFLNY